MDFIKKCDEQIYAFKEHSENVANASLKIYNSLASVKKAEVLYKKSEKYKPEEIIYMCGLYHDIGKNFINRVYPELLSKEKFTDADKELIKQHTIMGAQTLYEIANEYQVDNVLLRYMVQACLMHHERLNGKGYLGLTQAPKIAQLVGVADIYSAGIEKRCYEKEKEVNRLKQEMYSMSINQDYVDALFK